MTNGELSGRVSDDPDMDSWALLEDLDIRAGGRDRLPTKARLAALVQTLAQERQSRPRLEVNGVPDAVRTAFEEVVWGVEHVSRRVEALTRPLPDYKFRALQRELDEEQQWLLGRLEVLHGLLGLLSA